MFWPWYMSHVRAESVKTVKVHLVKVSGGLQCCIWGRLKPTVSGGSINWHLYWHLLLTILFARKHTMKNATCGPSVLCSWRCWVAGSETLSSAGVFFLLIRPVPCFTSGGAGVSVFERGRGTCDGYTEEALAVTCVEVLKPTKPCSRRAWGLHGITVRIRYIW